MTDRLAGGGLVAADLDGDGHVDLAAAAWEAPAVSVLLGEGPGSFRRPIGFRTARDPAAIAVADVDGDGDPDLVAASADRAGSVSVLANLGRADFRRTGTYASAPRATAVAAGDLDRDGTADLVVAGRRRLAVLRGEGRGRFRVAHRYRGAPAPAASRCVPRLALGDVDGDGRPDVALTSPRRAGGLAVRLGRGDGSFGAARRHAAGREPCDVDMADLDADARPDLVVVDRAGSAVSVFPGRGDGTFGARRTYVMHRLAGFGVDAAVIADLDGDGALDLATSSWAGAVLVRRGRGDGTFRAVQAIPMGTGNTSGGTVADFDGDGRPDLAFERGDSGDAWAYVLLNRTGRSPRLALSVASA